MQATPQHPTQRARSAARPRRGRGLAVWATALALALSALAVPAESHAQSRRAKQQAMELAGQAREAFVAQDYAKAAELLDQAFGLLPEPNFIWNTARAWELAGRYPQAEASYLRFITLEGTGEEERTLAQSKLARLAALRTLPDTVANQQDGAAVDTLAAANQALSSQLANGGDSDGGGGPSALGILGWSTAGVGVVALGAALTLQLTSIDTVETYHEAANEGTDRARYDALRDTLNARVTTSQVLLVSGLLLSAAGGTLLYFEYSDGGDQNPDASVAPLDATLHVAPAATPDGVGVSLGGTF